MNMNTEQQFDTIELKSRLLDPEDEYGDDIPDPYRITQAIFINGKNLAPSPRHAIYLTHLAKSCQLNGEFFIVTCSCCGDAGCAGINDGIQVTHEPDRIIWQVPNPISYAGMRSEEVEFIDSNRQYDSYVFRPEQYLHCIQSGLNEARALLFGNCQPVDCLQYVLNPEELLNLDPLVFSERGTPAGYHLIAKEIVLNRYPFGIEMNSIGYRLRELPVPDAIKALGDWSDWEPKRIGHGLIFNHAAAPRWEVRRRVKKLGRYLASILSPQGRVVIVDELGNTSTHQQWERRLVLRGHWQGH